MAVKKKLKAKSKAGVKAKRRKVAKPAAKAVRKPARKTPARRAAPKAAKPKAAKPRVARPKVAMAPPATPPERPAPGERIGVVTHYYGAPMVAIVKLETGTLRVGDSIHIRGHTSDFSQRVESLQVDHAPVNEVGPQDDFGIKVREHAREHDVVYKLPR